MVEELCTSTKNLKLGKLLLVDILNYNHKFFGKPREVKPYKSLSAVYQGVTEFVNAANKCGWELEVFIDDVVKSDEGEGKWRSRREDEVSNRKREIPQACNVLLGEMFGKLGVPVRYSFDADNDDTIMAHAVARNGSVLSGDRDMFRYIYSGPRVKVWSDFYVEKGNLTLVPHEVPTPRSEPRNIISPPPETKNRMHDWSHVKTYQRGSPSPLTRDLGNLHMHLRPLRRAVYQLYNATVKETFPIWDEATQQVKWDESEVTPDGTLSELLKDDPQVILRHFFPSLERQETFSIELWYNHLWAVHAVVFELLTQAFPDKYTLFDLMMEHFKPTKEILKGTIEETLSNDLAKPAVYAVKSCVVCRRRFEILQSEKDFFVMKGFRDPNKCKPCRQNKKKY